GVPPAVGEVAEFLQFGGIGVDGVHGVRGSLLARTGTGCARARHKRKSPAEAGLSGYRLRNYLEPMTSTSTRRSGCRQEICAARPPTLSHLLPVTGWVSPLPSV